MMSRSRLLYFLADVALLASLVFVALNYLHAGRLPDPTDEQGKAQWLVQRGWYDAGLYISFAVAALLFIAGLLVSRRELRR
jgi:NhaP-type Na+/H+ or K+/H+ antiporter